MPELQTKHDVTSCSHWQNTSFLERDFLGFKAYLSAFLAGGILQVTNKISVSYSIKREQFYPAHRIVLKIKGNKSRVHDLVHSKLSTGVFPSLGKITRT